MTDLTDDEIGFIFGGNLEHQDNEKDKDVYHCWCSNGNYGGVFYCRVNDCYYKSNVQDGVKPS